MNENVSISGLMSFKYDGQTRIDARLLSSSLNGFVEAYGAFLDFKYQGHDPGMEINVRAFAPGSFEVIIESIVQVLPAIAPYVPTALECGKDFLEIIKIKKELKGKKAVSAETSDSQMKITNHEGEIHYHNCTVYNTYINNPKIDAGLSKMFDSLHDSPRPAISFKASDQDVQVEQDNYEAMSIQIVDELDSSNLQTLSSTVQEQLLLKKPDLLGDSRWDFHYRGRTIHASIEDRQFIDDVKHGRIKQLYAGVRVPVEMRIEAYLNERLEVEKTLYTIVRISGDIIEPGSGSNQLMLEDIYE